MKKSIIFLSLFFIIFNIYGCAKNIDTKTEEPKSVNNKITLSTESKNDLIYHNYGTHIKLSKNSTIVIENLNLNLSDEQSAIIYIKNLKSNDSIQISKYTPNQRIEYKATSSGNFSVFAQLNDKKIIDLTSYVTIKENDTESSTLKYIN